MLPYAESKLAKKELAYMLRQMANSIVMKRNNTADGHKWRDAVRAPTWKDSIPITSSFQGRYHKGMWTYWMEGYNPGIKAFWRNGQVRIIKSQWEKPALERLGWI